MFVNEMGSKVRCFAALYHHCVSYWRLELPRNSYLFSLYSDQFCDIVSVNLTETLRSSYRKARNFRGNIISWIIKIAKICNFRGIIFVDNEFFCFRHRLSLFVTSLVNQTHSSVWRLSIIDYKGAYNL